MLYTSINQLTLSRLSSADLGSKTLENKIPFFFGRNSQKPQVFPASALKRFV
jgi:hypothetical protein